MRMIAILLYLLALPVMPAMAQDANQDLPYYDCDQFTGLKRMVCVFSQSEYRDPKYCPEIHQYKFVPASASCERGEGHRDVSAPARGREPPSKDCHSYDK